MSLRRPLTAALAGWALLTVPALAGAADPAPTTPDKVRPQLTSVRFTPHLSCGDDYANSGRHRQVFFTLSEPATVRLRITATSWGILPGKSWVSAPVSLPAGPHRFWDGDDYSGLSSHPVFFDRRYLEETGFESIQATDAAGNKSAVRYSGLVINAWYASSRRPKETYGCGTKGGDQLNKALGG